MNSSESEKTEWGPKRREGNDPCQVPSMCLPEGGGAIRRMSEKFAAYPVSGTGFMTAHNRGRSPIFRGLKIKRRPCRCQPTGIRSMEVRRKEVPG